MIGKTDIYLFVSRWNRFELLIATFQMQYYCQSSSDDEVDFLRIAICSMLFRYHWHFDPHYYSDRKMLFARKSLDRQLCFLIVGIRNFNTDQFL